MKKVIVQQNKLNEAQIRGLKIQTPNTEHISEIIREEAIVYVSGEIVAVYKRIDFDIDGVLETCLSLKFDERERTNGLVSKTINFNFSPRNALRQNVCRKSRLGVKYPSKHEVFIKQGKNVAKWYRSYFKTAYAHQVKSSYVGKKRIHPDYLIKGTPFTGGVINKNSNLNYHYDKANTSSGISCMIILKENILGGELILPELNIGFACQNRFLLLFDGKKLLHGVTKIHQAPGGYRYTIVYYNNSGMNLCLSEKEEWDKYQMYIDQPKGKLKMLLENEK
ncbi:hypothetical protein [Pedobacter cryophilus]|uniref:2OGFeDO JBP1/TET oxygenase domain-containing protein n=1 Tax=Pedobacter cryophilus TaxID=2571271 RepID=A0A4U1BUR6_9SPHI|nr:hypothetical protein [Pedobacter cryophilus]TKB95744.1 hypothetical protein FA046_15750 [Pedobacter cryophilus]